MADPDEPDGTDEPDLCPRCGHEEIATMAHSPVEGAWTVRQCRRCRYTWRTSEPTRRTRRSEYPAAFRMTAADIENAPEVPEVPG